MIVLLIAALIIVGPMLWPRGVIAVSVEKMFGGTLTTYERVKGLKALRAWWKGELEAEPTASIIHEPALFEPSARG